MTTEPRRRLARDERGAIVVIGLFASVFIVGVLYYLLGFGSAMRHGERMQDAADATTFSSAVMHARGMNLVALMNMVKLAVAVVLAGLLAIMAAATSTITWITSGGPHRFHRYAWTIPLLALVLAEAQSLYGSAEGPAREILAATDRIQTTLRDELPGIAVEKARLDVLPEYAPVAIDLRPWPGVRPLPIGEGRATDLCRRAMPYGVEMGKLAFSEVPSGKIAGRALGYHIGEFPLLCLAQNVRPQEVSDGQLGGEAYQLRLLIAGQPLATLGEQGVKVATFRADEDPGRIGALRADLSRVGFAQAEYYFEGPQAEAEMLWHMQWRARLRRFRFPGGVLPPELGLLGPGGDEWVVH
jgi:hypothetical protein